jgi:GNAT superfamily N-acetyltransferase
MGLLIRTATVEDASAACAVLRRSIVECCAGDHRHDPAVLDAWLGNKTPATVAGWIATPSNHALVAERDGVMVGVALINQAGKISLCYVVREALRTGTGKALLCGLEAQARAWGVGVVKLNSTATASGFYAHHGYVHGGKDTSCFGLECDFYWKQLNAESACDGARKRFCPCTGSA